MGAAMALLVGRHVNRIDSKGRVSVPKPFRAALAEQASNAKAVHIFAFPLFTAPAVQACGEAFMARLSASVERLDMFSPDQDDLAAIVLENAHALKMDPEGRVVLPPGLVAHAGLDDQVVFVGRGRQFQIWQPAAHATHSAQAFDRARARGATLRLAPDDGGPDDG